MWMSSSSNEITPEQEELYKQWKLAAPYRKDACIKAVNRLREILNTDIKSDEKMQQTVRVVQDELNLYHLGIYLAQDDRLVIYTGAGEAIDRMLARGVKREIKPEYGIVGHVGATREIRHFWDMGPDDNFYFKGPDLDDTKSEIAFPLLVKGELIGVMDLQSTLRCDFREEEYDAFQMLANEVSNVLATKV
jgi:putative methionine-R-sulfoxide reductase with GAF domain